MSTEHPRPSSIIVPLGHVPVAVNGHSPHKIAVGDQYIIGDSHGPALSAATVKALSPSMRHVGLSFSEFGEYEWREVATLDVREVLRTAADRQRELEAALGQREVDALGIPKSPKPIHRGAP